MADGYQDLGPSVRSRAEVYALARDVGEILQIVREITLPGPRCDVPRAERLIAEAAAKLGGSPP